MNLQYTHVHIPVALILCEEVVNIATKVNITAIEHVLCTVSAHIDSYYRCDCRGPSWRGGIRIRLQGGSPWPPEKSKAQQQAEADHWSSCCHQTAERYGDQLIIAEMRCGLLSQPHIENCTKQSLK